MMNRRDFFVSGSAFLAASILLASSNAEAKDKRVELNFPDEIDPVLPKLPYGYGELEPVIDRQTMILHHTKHHQAYVDGIILAKKQLADARSKNDFTYISYWSKKLAFATGGHYLHCMFWEIMAPLSSGNTATSPGGRIGQLLEKRFGSFDRFREQFNKTALDIEGSGWAVLAIDKTSHALEIFSIENQHKLLPSGFIPVMGIDVWEHAYYLKYQNKRKDYVEAWMRLVNWKEVERRIA